MTAAPPREEPVAPLVAVACGVCILAGLGLLAWALASHALQAPVRGALLGAGLLLLAASALHWRLARRAAQLQARAEAAQQAVQQASRQLLATLDILPDGLAIYDADDRLVLCNTRYREVAPGTEMPLAYGTRFEDVLRRAASSGQIMDAQPDMAAWLAGRMARHRAPTGPEVQEVRGDRWMRMTERPLDGGGVVVLRSDITDVVHKERALKQALQDAERAERSLREAVDAMPAGLEIYDENDRLVLCNEHMARMRPQVPVRQMLGRTYEDLLREGLRHGIPEEASGQEELWLAHELAIRGHRPGPEVRHYPGGTWMHMHESRTPSGMTVCVRLDITDLIEQRQVAEAARQESLRSRQLLERAVEALPVSIEIFDEQDRLVLYNQQLSRMYPHMDYAQHLGSHFADILRHSVDRGLIPSAQGREEAWIAERLSEHGCSTSTLVQRLADGRWINIYETRTPENYVVAVRLDITDLIEQRQALESANEKLALLSTTDGVTGIGNRRRFDERLATEWLRCGRHQSPLAVVMIDIDHFKRYNDHYGHLAGDECLRRVAQLLQATIRRADEVAARYGGEEFVLLLPDTLLPDAVTVAQRCMDSLRACALPHPRSPTAAMLTLSIGIASLVPHADARPDTLVQAADAALYRAKRGGRNRLETFAAPPLAAPAPLTAANSPTGT